MTTGQKLTLHGLSSSNLICRQLRRIHHDECKVFLLVSSCLAKFAKAT